MVKANDLKNIWKPGKVGGMKNKFKICGDYSIIYIKRFDEMYESYVDTDDLYRLFSLGRTWHFLRGDKEAFYIGTKIGHKKVLLHRLLLEAPEDKLVDHINGKPQDNRRINLRLASVVENAQNRIRLSALNKSGVRGVIYEESMNAWRVFVNVDKKQMDFGIYQTKELAEYVATMVRRNLMPYSKDARLTDEELNSIRISG